MPQLPLSMHIFGKHNPRANETNLVLQLDLEGETDIKEIDTEIQTYKL